jgi:hypothetical protein
LERVEDLAKHTLLVINHVSAKINVSQVVTKIEKVVEQLSSSNDKNGKMLSKLQKNFLEHYTTHDKQIILMPKALDSDVGKLVDLTHVSNKVTNAVKNLLPLELALPLNPNFIGRPDYIQKIQQIYKSKLDEFDKYVEAFVQKVIKKFSRERLDSSEQSRIIYTELCDTVKVGRVSDEGTKQKVQAFATQAIENLGFNREVLSIIEDSFGFMLFCEELLRIEQYRKIRQDCMQKIKIALDGFITTTQEAIKEKRDFELTGLEGKMRLFFDAEVKNIKKALRLDSADFFERINLHQSTKYKYNEWSTKMKESLAELDKMKTINNDISNLVTVILFIDTLILGQKSLNHTKNIKKLYSEAQVLINNIFNDSEKSLGTIMSQKTQELFSSFFKEVCTEVGSKKFIELKEYLEFLPDTPKKLGFQDIIQHIINFYKGDEQHKQAITDLLIMINTFSNVFPEYNFETEKKLFINAFEKEFMSKVLGDFNLVSLFVRFGFDEQVKKYCSATVFEETKRKEIELAKKETELNNKQIALSNKETELNEKTRIKETKLNEKETGLKKYDQELKDRKEELDNRCCSILSIPDLEYDNELLNHPDFVLNVISSFGASGLSTLLDITDNLSASSVSDLVSLPMGEVRDYFFYYNE